MRARPRPPVGGEATTVRLAVVPAAAVAPDEPDDAIVDGVLPGRPCRPTGIASATGCASCGSPHGPTRAGDGAALRMAAARAALVRLVAATADFDEARYPTSSCAAGGVWSAVPGADGRARPRRRAPAVRGEPVRARPRPAARPARGDPRRRRSAAAAHGDLVDDLLAPLGSVVTPAGLRAGRSAGTVVVHARDGMSELDLVPGGLELVDLPPGETAVAEFRFRDRVRLGARGRHFAVDVAGGLGGLLVDLRDVPLRLPDRADRRRDLLAAWQTALWAGSES